jgi:DNA-binding NarL/FixJ family response regulator
MEIRKIRVIAVDSQPLIRDGLAALFASQPEFTLVAEASTGQEAVRQFRQHHPDVMLMDLQLPDMSGIDAICRIRRDCPTAKIVILTAILGDVIAQKALRAGALGYLPKSSARKDLLDAIRAVHAGGKRIHREVADCLAEHLGQEDISAREMQVLELIKSGYKNKQIANALSIAETTVNYHIRNIVDKLQARDRTHAVTLAASRGILNFSKRPESVMNGRE